MLLSLLNPYVLLSVIMALGLAYGGGRLQQYVGDVEKFDKKIAQMQLEAEAEKVRIEEERRQEREKAEKKQRELRRERDQQMALAEKRVAHLDAAITALRAPAVGGLLNDTIDEAGRAPGVAGKPREGATPAAQGADTTVGLWAQWSVQVIGLYASCRDQVIGLQDFYNQLRRDHRTSAAAAADQSG